MPTVTNKDWPFKVMITEDSTLSLLPLQEEASVALLLDIGNYYLVLDRTVEMLGIDYNVSKLGQRTIKWNLLNKNNWRSIDKLLNDIQEVTGTMVIRSSI
jgi:hypothetical protein